MQVAGLSSRITTDVDDALRSSTQDGLHHVGVHACSWRVGDDDIGTAVLLDECIVEDVFHIASIKECVRNAVDCRIYLSILDGLRHILYTDDLTGLTSHEIGDGARARIEVVNQGRGSIPNVSRGSLNSRSKGKFPDYAIEMIGLLCVRLVERLRANLEFQVLHPFEDMILALEGQNLLVADGVVAFLIVEVHQRGNLRILVGQVLQQRQSLSPVLSLPSLLPLFGRGQGGG